MIPEVDEERKSIKDPWKAMQAGVVGGDEGEGGGGRGEESSAGSREKKIVDEVAGYKGARIVVNGLVGEKISHEEEELDKATES